LPSPVPRARSPPATPAPGSAPLTICPCRAAPHAPPLFPVPPPEGIRNGLDFEQALADPELPDFVTSPQMLIQLRRFNTTAQGALAARSAARSAAAAPGGGGGGGGGGARGARIGGTGGGGGGGGLASSMERDLGRVIGSATSDKAGVDTSIQGGAAIGAPGGFRALGCLGRRGTATGGRGPPWGLGRAAGRLEPPALSPRRRRGGCARARGPPPDRPGPPSPSRRAPRPCPPRPAVLRRVLLLLLALTGLGVGLFYLGLEYVLKVN
jgi:hypothetical protein